MIKFIWKNLRRTEYRLQAKEYNKMSHTILKNNVNNKEKNSLK